MRNILLILLFTLTIYAHDQWIQVFTGDVVEQRFLDVVGSHGYESIVINEDNKSKVLIGGYISQKAASSQLKEIRCNIAEDAFIRQYSYYPHSIVQETPMEEVVMDVNTTAEEISENCICPKNKKYRRELEIGSALEFYRNSSHYHFEH